MNSWQLKHLPEGNFGIVGMVSTAGSPSAEKANSHHRYPDGRSASAEDKTTYAVQSGTGSEARLVGSNTVL